MGVAEHVGYLKKEKRNSDPPEMIWCLLRTFIPMGFSYEYGYIQNSVRKTSCYDHICRYD